MKDEQVQIRITAPGKHLLPEGYVRQGKVLWVSRRNAEQYINVLKIAEPAGAGIGPTETKPTGPAAKKSSGAVPDGRSTDSAKSSEGGTVQQSFLSRADRASSAGRPGSSRRGEGESGPGSSGASSE